MIAWLQTCLTIGKVPKLTVYMSDETDFECFLKAVDAVGIVVEDAKGDPQTRLIPWTAVDTIIWPE